MGDWSIGATLRGRFAGLEDGDDVGGFPDGWDVRGGDGQVEKGA